MSNNNNNRKRITRHFLSISELMNRISPKVTCICFVSSVLFVLTPLIAARSEVLVRTLKNIMTEWEVQTCIKFKTKTVEKAYIRFIYGKG